VHNVETEGLHEKYHDVEKCGISGNSVWRINEVITYRAYSRFAPVNVYVVISRKRCKMQSLLLQSTNRK